MFDIHSHLVPGVDDGVEDLGVAEKALATMHQGGTTQLWATPHIAEVDGYDASDERLTLIGARFSELQAVVPDGMTVRLGYEVTASRPLLAPGVDIARFALEDLDIALLDGPEDEPAEHEELLLPYIFKVRAAGLRPVLAHPERRADPTHPTRDPGFAERHADAGALLQVDACALLGSDGPEVGAEAWRLVEQGLAELVASDTHGVKESGDLATVHAAIAKRIDRVTADRLCGGLAITAPAEFTTLPI